jgi:high-affinity iron transporter
MLASGIIVFREMLEAGLVVGVILAATRGVPRRGRWVAGGLAAGALGACAVAAFAGQLASLFQGAGQELFNAAVLGAAVVMLTWHDVWMSSHGRELAEGARRLGAAVVSGRRPLAAVALVCGVALLREGSEVVLFLYGVAVSGEVTPASLAAGGAVGLLAGAAVAALVYLGLVAIPIRRLFAVTTALITLLAAGLAAQAVAFLQQAGRLEVLTSTVWDLSGVLPEDGWAGRVLHSLIGYTDRPSGAQLVVYATTVAGIAGLMALASRARRRARPAAPAAAPTLAREG